MSSKYLAVGLALALLFSLVGFTGCGTSTSSVAGLYVNQDDPHVFLQLNSDGTFAAPFGMHGSWQVDGDELTLITPLGLDTARIEGNKIIEPYGTIWVKKGTDSKNSEDLSDSSQEPHKVQTVRIHAGDKTWLVSLESVKWSESTVILTLSVRNEGSSPAKFGYMFSEAFNPSFHHYRGADIVVKDSYGMLFDTKSREFYKGLIYPGETRKGVLQFTVNPRSGQVGLYLSPSAKDALFYLGSPSSEGGAMPRLPGQGDMSRRLENAILGKWRHGLPEKCPPTMDQRQYEEFKKLPENKTYYLEFLKNGKLCYSCEGQTVEGTYTFTDDDYVEIVWYALVGTFAQEPFVSNGAYKVQISGNNMILQGGQGLEASYCRVD